MIRLPFSERRFAFALIVSAAIHTAVLPVALSLLSGSAPRQARPVTESCIKAFLVPGHLAAAGKPALPGRKRRAAEGRAVPAAVPLQDGGKHVSPVERGGNDLLSDGAAAATALLPRRVPEHAAPTETEGRKMLADIRPPAEWPGAGHEMAALPASMLRSPAGGDRSRSDGAGMSASGRGNGEFPDRNGAGVPASGQEGTGKPDQKGSGERPPKDADAVPRYGDNARPAYPPLARLRGYQGVAVLFVEVLADGRVGRMGIRRSAGHEILDRAALEAVRSWRFDPGRREGRAVPMSVEVPVRFVLNEYSAR
ncbi:MAG: energy transducer TonB [Deltaproteobacteria bacterium]|nr:energy transducer TonB [Deltaproteobacteria bacterium]